MRRSVVDKIVDEVFVLGVGVEEVKSLQHFLRRLDVAGKFDAELGPDLNHLRQGGADGGVTLLQVGGRITEFLALGRFDRQAEGGAGLADVFLGGADVRLGRQESGTAGVDFLAGDGIAYPQTEDATVFLVGIVQNGAVFLQRGHVPLQLLDLSCAPAAWR